MTPHRIAAGLAGLALGGVLAACSGTPASSSSSGYAPITSGQSSSAPALTVPTDPSTAGASGVTDPTSAAAATSAAGTAATGSTGTGSTGTGSTGTAGSGSTRTAGTARTAPQQAPNYAALAQQFVTLRDTGTAALATVKGQASSSDLNADKQLMAYAAKIFASYYNNLNALPFPAQMKADEQTLAKAIAASYGTFMQASQVQTFDQLNPLLQTLVNDRDDQLNATDQVEKDLGLPQSTPAPGS